LGRKETGKKEQSSAAHEFLQWHEKHNILPQQKRNVIRQRLASATKKGTGSPTITDVLNLVYPKFRRALIQLNNEKPDRALAQLAQLEENKDPYLASNVKLYEARAYMQNDNYKEASPLLQSVIEKGLNRVHSPSNALLDLALSQTRTLQNEKALKNLKQFKNEYPNASVPQRVQAQQLFRKIMLSRRSPVHEIERLMGYSHRRIKLNRLGPVTQQRQKRIVKSLNELIKKIKKQQKSRSGGAGAGGGRAGTTMPSPGGGPASKSQLPGGGNKTGPLNRIMRGKVSESWGKLPPKEREKALNHIQSKYPERYRELIEQYYKSLQEEGE
jgi:TolA-binding protein